MTRKSYEVSLQGSGKGTAGETKEPYGPIKNAADDKI